MTVSVYPHGSWLPLLPPGMPRAANELLKMNRARWSFLNFPPAANFFLFLSSLNSKSESVTLALLEKFPVQGVTTGPLRGTSEGGKWPLKLGSDLGLPVINPLAADTPQPTLTQAPTSSLCTGCPGFGL